MPRLLTICFDIHRLHVILGPGLPRCAGPAAPRSLHPPQVHRLSLSPHPTAGGVPLLSTMRSDSHHSHVALGPGLPRCAGPAAPRRLHRPPVATAPLITAVRRGASPAPRRGTASFNHVLRPPSPPRRPRGPSGRVRHAAQGPLPLAAFTALLSPSASSPRVFAKELRPHPGGGQLLSTMLFDSHHLLVTLGPDPPRWAEPAGPSPPSSPSCRRNKKL